LISSPMLRKSKKQRRALIAIQMVACLRPFRAIEAKKSRISRCVTSVAGVSLRNWQSDTTEAEDWRFVVAVYSRTPSQRANRDARSALNSRVEGIAELGEYILGPTICQRPAFLLRHHSDGRQESFCPLDKDLSWKSRYRTCAKDIRTAELNRRVQVTATSAWPNSRRRDGNRGRLSGSSTC